MRFALFLTAGALTLSLAVAGRARGESPTKYRERTAVNVGENFRPFPGAVTQTEPFICRHPTNPRILFASANTINLATGFVSEGVYVTTDAGATWSGSDTCKGAPITFHRGDPAIAIDKDGRFTLVRLGSSPGLYAHVSTDNGTSWSSQRTIALDDQGRGAVATDAVPTSPYFGRTYAVWIRFAPPYPVWFSFTTDGGGTWSTPGQVNSPGQRGQGGDVAVGPDGSLNVCWAGVPGSSPFTEDFVGFARSTNGGTLWQVQENAFDMNGIAGTFPAKSGIRVNGLPRIGVDNSGGPRNGWIYIVTTERGLAPAGNDPDVVFHRSTDDGATWSPGIRVNQDAPNNGKFQFFPALHVDDGGGINVLYYDDRLTATDSAGVALSRSTDGGATWADYGISDNNFRPVPIGGLGQGYQGDNIAMISVGDTLWPLWMDNRTGLYQIWTSAVRISELGTDVREDALPVETMLAQNYPNPFNPVTRIRFRMRSAGAASLKISDVLGREVATLVDGWREAGSGEVVFDAPRYSLPSGVYLYTLTTGDARVTRMMLLLK